MIINDVEHFFHTPFDHLSVFLLTDFYLESLPIFYEINFLMLSLMWLIGLFWGLFLDSDFFFFFEPESRHCIQPGQQELNSISKKKN